MPHRISPRPVTGDSAVLIVPDKLVGSDNYQEWAQSMQLALDGREKLGYITGETTEPAKTEERAWRRWKSENSIVYGWLINSMVSSVKKPFMFLPTAQDIWSAVRESYGNSKNAARAYDIRARIWSLKQEAMILTDYYHDKVSLWQELDLLKAKV